MDSNQIKELFNASKNGDLESFRSLLAKNEIDINLADVLMQQYS